jgi:hypothetical protein
MVIYEAARALVNLKNVESRDLCPAIAGKQDFSFQEFLRSIDGDDHK